MADNPNISGYVVVGDWNASGVYKGGQGASVVNYALTTWQAVSPRRGVPPGTIAGEWLRVPTKVQQTAPFVPPPPAPAPKPIAYTANAPLSVNGTILNVATMRASGAGAASGVVPTPPSVAGTTKFLREDATWAVAGGGGGGTVTSVALAAPAEFNVSGSPVIAAGTLTLAWANENANVAFMGPTSGGAAVPTFRAIVPADLAGTPGAGKYWDGIGTWTTLPAPGTGTVTSVGLSTNASYLTIGSTPVTTSGVITANKTTGLTANQVVATPDGAPGAADLRALVNADLPTSGASAGSYTYTALTVNAQGIITAASSGAAPTGTVTSVALTVPSIFTVGGSPITTSGTLAVTLNNENANLIFAGPTSGGAATPTFRSMVALDLPNTTVVAGSYTYSAITVDAQGRLTAASSGSAPTGTVTSVALTAPTEITVGGSPITTSGTLALSWTNESANKVFAGPSTGSPGTPTFRSLVAADFPAGTGTVTSVAMTAPSFLSVGGSPITTSGTLAVTLATESANTIFAGPATGVADTPTFRTQVAEDIATGTATSGYAPFSTGVGAKPAWGPPSFSSVGSLYAYSNTTQTIIVGTSDSYDAPGNIGANHTGLTGNAGTDVVTDTAHGYSNGQRVVFSAITGGAGLLINTQYYVINAATNTYQLATAAGGAAINFTTNITAGTINAVDSLQISIPSSNTFTTWLIDFVGIVNYGTTSTRSMVCAFVNGTNVNAAPGNSGLLWPVAYASNTGGTGWYAGTTVEIGSGSPYQFHVSGAILTTPSGASIIKVVYAARVALDTSVWRPRALSAFPLS